MSRVKRHSYAPKTQNLYHPKTHNDEPGRARKQDWTSPHPAPGFEDAPKALETLEEGGGHNTKKSTLGFCPPGLGV